MAVKQLASRKGRSISEMMPIWEMVDNTTFDHISSISSPSPKSLHPLPVLGIPGWWHNQYEEFYNNTNYFRSKKLAT